MWGDAKIWPDMVFNVFQQYENEYINTIWNRIYILYMNIWYAILGYMTDIWQLQWISDTSYSHTVVYDMISLQYMQCAHIYVHQKLRSFYKHLPSQQFRAIQAWEMLWTKWPELVEQGLYTSPGSSERMVPCFVVRQPVLLQILEGLICESRSKILPSSCFPGVKNSASLLSVSETSAHVHPVKSRVVNEGFGIPH